MSKLSLVITIVVWTLYSNNINAQWQQTNGPYGGDIRALAVSGSNIFAGAYNNGNNTGGVFLSSNNGSSWMAVNNGMTATSVFSLAMSGTNIFAGTNGGVFLSSNNGGNWTAVNNGLPATGVISLAVSGTNIFAGTNGGVFLSSNNGGNWTAVNNGLTNTFVNALSVSGSNIFAGTSGSTFLSTNNGSSWTAVNNGLPATPDVHSFAVSGSNIFAGTSYGVYLSTNNGSSWTALNNGLPATPHIQSFTVSGSDIFAGTLYGVFLSTNNGSSWTAVNNGLTNTSVYSLAVSGSNVFAGTSQGGVFLSTNNGGNWTTVNNGLAYTDVRSLVVSGSNVFAAIFGGVFLSTNNGVSWTAVNSGLTNPDVLSLAVSGSSIFAGTYNFGVFLSTNNGSSWTAVNNGLTNTYVSALGVSGSNIFAGTPGGVFLSSNNGVSWTAVNNGLTYPGVLSLAVSGSNIFAGTTGGVFLSSNNGGSWTAVNNGLPALINVNSLAVSGINLFAGHNGGGVFLSTNNGSSWTTVNNGLTNTYVNSLAVSGSNIFAGTQNGVFLSTNNGSSWTAVSNGLTNASVWSLAVSGSNIFAGPAYGGVFIRPLSEMISVGCLGFTASLSSTQHPNGFNIGCHGESSGSILVNATGGVLPYTYDSGIASSLDSTLTNLYAGFYTVIVTDQMGCTATDTITLTEPDTLVPLISSATLNGGNVSCYGNSDGWAFVESVIGGSIPFSYNWSNGGLNDTITGLLAGNYSLQIVDFNGCSYTASTVVTSPSQITPTLNYQNCSTSGSNDGFIQLDPVNGGISPYSYLWSPGGQTTSNVTGLSPGTYTYTITDANGCSISANVNIIVNGGSNPTYWIGFYTSVENNSALGWEKLIEQGTSTMSAPLPAKICADGSKSTVIKITCSDPTVNMSDIKFRIANFTNINIDGNFDVGDYSSSSSMTVVRYTHPTFKSSGSEFVSKTIQVYNQNSPGTILFSYPVNIYQAPVLMVHGLWGDVNSFADLEAYLVTSNAYPPSWGSLISLSPLLFRIDYEESNDYSFGYNSQKVPLGINSLLFYAREDNFSAGKVDVVAHSMGGLLTRIYFENIYGNQYRNDIHKFISLNTPHAGTQGANMLWYWHNTFCSATRVAMTPAPYRYGCPDAIENLRVNSSDIGLLNNSTNLNLNLIPTFSIVTVDASISDFQDCGIVINDLLTPLAWFNSISNGDNNLYMDNLFGGQSTDLIVPEQSQEGGIDRTQIFYNQCHLKSPSNPDIMIKVLDLLESPPTFSFFDDNGFSPPTQAVPPSGYYRTSSPSFTYSVQITAPAHGSSFMAGSQISINTIGDSSTSNLSLYIGNKRIPDFSQVSSVANNLFLYSIPPNAFGSILIEVIGVDSAGNFSMDTLTIDVGTTAVLDSMSFYPDVHYLPVGDRRITEVVGHFSDGIDRTLSHNSGLVISIADTNIARLTSSFYIQGKDTGSTIATYTFQGISGQVPVTIYQGEPWLNAINEGNFPSESKGSGYGELKFQLYPNPVNDRLTIEQEGYYGEHVHLSLYDVFGRLVVEKTDFVVASDNSKMINIEALPSGIYYVVLSNGKIEGTRKFVKM